MSDAAFKHGRWSALMSVEVNSIVRDMGQFAWREFSLKFGQISVGPKPSTHSVFNKAEGAATHPKHSEKRPKSREAQFFRPRGSPKTGPAAHPAAEKDKPVRTPGRGRVYPDQGATCRNLVGRVATATE
jgi:hypothetical protein